MGWVWALVIIVFVLLVAWWGYRTTRQVTGETGESKIRPLPETSINADDLTLIEGIGPKICGLLQSAGITTFSQLAAMRPEQIDAILHAAGLRLADPATWPEQARLASIGDYAALQTLKDRLRGGRQG